MKVQNSRSVTGGPSALVEQRKAMCANCRKPISRTGAGADWYHRHNASTSCYPGSRARKRAEPCEVEIEP